MKKLLIVAAFAMLCGSVSGQSAKEMLAEIQGKWELDNSGNVTFTRVIELPGTAKDELYTRALSYFTYNYNSGDDVVQVREKEQGVIVGKGVYPEVHVGMSLITTTVDTYHILRVDLKEGRLRVMVTLTDYRITLRGGNGVPSVANCPVSSRYPIAKKDIQKTVMSKAFYKSYRAAMSSLDGLEKSVKEGNTGFDTNEW